MTPNQALTAEVLAGAVERILLAVFDTGGGCVEGPDWEWDEKEHARIAKEAAAEIAALSAPPTPAAAGGEVSDSLTDRLVAEANSIFNAPTKPRDEGVMLDLMNLLMEAHRALSAPPKPPKGAVGRFDIARMIRDGSMGGGCEIVAYHKAYAVTEKRALEIADTILAALSQSGAPK